MNEEQIKLQECLRAYHVPAVPKKRMEKLISAGEGYINSPEFNKNFLWDMLLNQLHYLPLSFWAIHGLLAAVTVLLARLSDRWQISLYYPLAFLSIIIPLLVLLGVKEISKSSIFNMWEIEQSSRCTLVKITACRMLTVGLIDLFFVTGSLIGISCLYPWPMIGMILYGMVPFNISCSCYMFTVIKNEKGRLSYHLLACMIFLSAVFSFVMRQRFLFETSMLWCWGVFYLLSVILLGKAVRKYLKHEKKIGELAWNLP